MRLTNKLNLPAPIVEAVRNDGYNSGRSDISATGLIEPVRIHALKERYGDELEEDVADRIYSLEGQALHTILERAGLTLPPEEWLLERRFYLDVPLPDGTVGVLSGQIDVFEIKPGILADYKRTSVFSLKDGAKKEHIAQTNIGRILLEEGYELVNLDGTTYREGVDDFSKAIRIESAGKYTVKQLTIVGMFRDWSKNEYRKELKAARDKGFEETNYPPHQTGLYPVVMWPRETTLRFITERMQAHKTAHTTPDDQLPVCTGEERWERPGKWAIMKPGLQRASKLFDTLDAAQQALVEYGKGAKIEERPGESVRCSAYCPVASTCTVAKKNGWVK